MRLSFKKKRWKKNPLNRPKAPKGAFFCLKTIHRVIDIVV